jgi:hypothetical protein
MELLTFPAFTISLSKGQISYQKLRANMIPVSPTSTMVEIIIDLKVDTNDCNKIRKIWPAHYKLREKQ